MIYKKQNSLISERIDDQVLVFDLNTNLPYVLNDVAAYIFMNTDGKLNAEAIAEKVCRQYQVEFQQALDDIKDLYEDFARKKIIMPVE